MPSGNWDNAYVVAKINTLPGEALEAMMTKDDELDSDYLIKLFDKWGLINLLLNYSSGTPELREAIFRRLKMRSAKAAILALSGLIEERKSEAERLSVAAEDWDDDNDPLIAAIDEWTSDNTPQTSEGASEGRHQKKNTTRQKQRGHRAWFIGKKARMAKEAAAEENYAVDQRGWSASTGRRVGFLS